MCVWFLLSNKEEEVMTFVNDELSIKVDGTFFIIYIRIRILLIITMILL